MFFRKCFHYPMAHKIVPFDILMRFCGQPMTICFIPELNHFNARLLSDSRSLGKLILFMIMCLRKNYEEFSSENSRCADCFAITLYPLTEHETLSNFQKQKRFVLTYGKNSHIKGFAEFMFGKPCASSISTIKWASPGCDYRSTVEH